MLRGLCGCYGVYVDVTGFMWLLRGLCRCYGVYVAVTGSMYMLITGFVWLLRGLCRRYGVYVAVTGSTSSSFSRKSRCVLCSFYGTDLRESATVAFSEWFFSLVLDFRAKIWS